MTTIARNDERFGRLIGPPFELVVLYVALMPFLVGIPRGGLVPVLRPSEAMQLAVTGGGLALAGWALLAGQRWRLRIRAVEWWLLAMAAAGSVVPLLWLLARSEPLGRDELLAAFPFVKYAALYFLVRLCVRTEAEVSAVTKALVAAAAVIAVLAITQALGVGPVVDVLGRFFVSSTEDVVDGGRGTTTIGSSIATGAYLAVSCGVALSRGLQSTDRRWLLLAAFLGIGGLASGQAGTVLAIGVVVIAVAQMHHRSVQLLTWGIPAAALGTISLWPIVSARLADLDQGSGLPESWIIRWNNISELYLPSLADFGWVLGVNPDAVVAPPDVWRQTIYLESGYLWLLWVGGLPLLGAAVGFLISAWRTLDPKLTTGHPATPEGGTGALRAVRIAARAAVAMVGFLSIIDPHLTLRAGADLLFVLIALGMTGAPLAVPVTTASVRWRKLLAADVTERRYGRTRLQLAEASPAGPDPRSGADPEMTLGLTARLDGTIIGSTRLALYRAPAGLRGVVIDPIDGPDRAGAGLTWRAVVLTARSLRLIELHVGAGVGAADLDPNRLDGPKRLEAPPGAASIHPAELKSAAKLADKLEIERADQQRRAAPSDDLAQAESGTAPEAEQPGRSGRSEQPGRSERSDRPLPAIRLDLDATVPVWKRAVDLTVGSLALIATAPLWLLTGLLVKRSGDGPILYRQVRIGTGGLPFQIYKFRTMYLDNDDTAHRIQNCLELRGEAEAAKDEADPRITPVGRWLRRLSLDELPQLLNVLRSEMSLVGPRPSLVWESELFQPAARRRLVARPGLTGLWQTSGRADVSMAEMLDLDLDYVDNMGPRVDLNCLVKTASSVVAGKGAR